jgi:protein-S-isoprenylcysteine O-methyltransferase Ste14
VGWDLSELRRRLTLYASGAVVACVLAVLAFVYLAIALHAAWLLVLHPALAALCTAGSLLLLVGLIAGGIAVYLRRREAWLRRNRPPPRDLLSEGIALTRRHPLVSVGVAFVAGVAASKSDAAEAAVTAALLQSVGKRR